MQQSVLIEVNCSFPRSIRGGTYISEVVEMALLRAGGLLLTVTLEAASAVGMELAMFCVAATVYVL